MVPVTQSYGTEPSFALIARRGLADPTLTNFGCPRLIRTPFDAERTKLGLLTQANSGVSCPSQGDGSVELPNFDNPAYAHTVSLKERPNSEWYVREGVLLAARQPRYCT